MDVITINRYESIHSPARGIILVKDTLLNLPKTVHGGVAWKLRDVEDYSHNLNPFGSPECIEDIIRSAASGVDHYPDDSCSELKDELARHFDLENKNVLIGAGSSEIIRAFPNVFLREGEGAMIFRPSFAEYAQQCRIVGAKVIDGLLTESDDFRIVTDHLFTRMSKNIKALYICNPNNPTGRIEPRDKVISIIEECERRGIMVFLDETLLELVPDYKNISCAKYVTEYDNLVVAGSLTKSFAIPGIRIGFGFTSEENAELMNRIRLPWNVGHIEQKVATELFKNHMGHVEKAAEMMRTESQRMYSRLKDIGFPISAPTDSFFFFNSVQSLHKKASDLQKDMLEHKFMVRDCASFGAPFEWYVRFCVKDRVRNDRFIDAMEDVLRSPRW